MEKNVAAIIVTFNRKELLRNCINAILGQTKVPDKIYIIDNDSNDGTDRLINEQFSKNPIIDYHRLENNIGGAGGFYSGMILAYEAGFEWLWLMDDDGILAHDALENLLLKKDSGKVLNCIVVNKDKPEDLAFGFDELTSVMQLEKKSKDLLYPAANFFNGTFINRAVVDDVGFVNPDFFIWGDEREYYLRISKKYKIYTITNSVLFHPRNVSSESQKFLGLTLPKYNYDWKFYYRIRNITFINKNNLSRVAYFKFVVYQFISILVSSIHSKRHVKTFIFFSKAFFHGLTGKLGINYLPGKL